MLNPTYIVTPISDTPNAVRIETDAPDWQQFYDECDPVVLQAMTSEAQPVMQSFLAGLAVNSSWTNRENGGVRGLRSGKRLTDDTVVTLVHCTHKGRPAPTSWYCVMTGPDDSDLLELNVVDENLANQLFEAFVEGTLTLRLADPVPV